MTSGAVMSYGQFSVSLVRRVLAMPVRTFFLRSGRFRVRTFAMIVDATKSLYEMSSVAVNVDSASSKSSPPRLNCRMERR